MMYRYVYYGSLTGMLLQGLVGCGLGGVGPKPSEAPQSDVAAETVTESLLSRGIGAGIEFYRPSPKTSAVAKTMDGANFELQPQSFPREKVAEFQTPGTDKTGTPKSLQGIWWMDGNAACSCTASFAEVDFSAENPIMSNFSENNFSYQGGQEPVAIGKKGDASYETGVKSFRSAITNSSIYEFHFKGSDAARFDQAEIMPVVKMNVLGIPLSIRFKPSLIKFGFKKVNDDLYLRENFVFGKKAPGWLGQYHFKRILKPSDANPDQLEKTVYWDEFVGPNTGKKVVPPAMLRLPRAESP